ncbi:uncharacterized protein Triagg1_7567 [Trichoderma aggressivum f. europaeum]|uniref:HhH-GPD domain-containing protein n=1 Tax=Trichoderma aggressivum f. europaeum TaxID=173218 RepID=A0AAE1I919_9HYPO|nr:hypothetical protein Triagg1_7567 [Trichoderma aggressivum f. europaeum]
MPTSFGQSILSVFDVWEDSSSFLSEVLESGDAPIDEVQCLFDQSLTGGAEDWHYLIDCARSIRCVQNRHPESLDGGDILSFVWEIFDGYDGASPSIEPWGETDRLIALAKDLERDVEILPPSLPTTQSARKSASSRAQSRVKKQHPGTTSHYWPDKPLDQTRKTNNRQDNPSVSVSGYLRGSHIRLYDQAIQQGTRAALLAITSTSDAQPLDVLSSLDGSRLNNPRPCSAFCKLENEKETLHSKRSTKSPYFLQKPSPKEESPKKKRPPPGTISCIPFPPLDSHSFGIIQEELAHDPFWLLIAITFLIKTSGQVALPALRRVKERFPTPLQLLDPSIKEELLDMIRHLGLSNVRLAYILRYATAFVHQPPKSGVRYRVKNYDKRDMSPTPRDLSSGDSQDSEMSHSLSANSDQDLEAWEIGHMTQGKYAIDSWRIFCRDELLGRAEDWNGKGRQGEFQPEWMRVKPADKELRACLRWMWMREGWEWDPTTGERTVLREEMRRAVNEGRVEYDDTGALRILTV